MRSLARNRRAVYYATLESSEPIFDEYGNHTGEYENVYADKVGAMVNVSAAIGETQSGQFGDLESYDKVIVTCDIKLPITETSVLWIDDLEGETHDYIVRKVARSINSITYAAAKVSVS